MPPDALIEEGTGGDGKPVRGDVPAGEHPAQQQDTGQRQPEGIQPRRVVELDELDRRRQNSGE